ncbi:MAG: hypothetical protein M5U28_47665 [Sandaracinaceae bacterium]|nr:hypothetical protein [Sandaracinaceae bacterium]
MAGVDLKGGLRASQLLFDVLNAARERHPEAFQGLRWPAHHDAFRRDYAAALIAFERRRLASPDRAEIARTIVRATDASMVYAGSEEAPLSAYMQRPAEPLPTTTVKLERSAGLVPEVTFRGEHYEGARLGELADRWLERRWMTESAHGAVRWTLGEALKKRSGRADLVGHKCVSLGAGAELSPTRAMLRAGADVLFVDARDPSRELLDDPRVSGTLTYVPGGADLLEKPREIVATIARFAADRPVHVGMYAYAGGAGKEWRLTSAMNAIVRALPAGSVRSVVMLISPTTPGRVSPEDAAAAEERRARLALRPLGLGRSQAAVGQSGELPNRVSHSIVGLQGVSYQAAQYIGKMMAAEVYAIYGIDGGGTDLTVSAPVAPITATRSLNHPLFAAGFRGAELFDILVSEPQATRVMCALLAFHDLLAPDAPSRSTSRLPPAERVAAIVGEQIHGGVYAQPYSLEREITLAALVGLAKSPKLVPPALRFLVRGR